METIQTSTTSQNNFDRSVFQFLSYLLQYPDKKWLQWQELVTEAEQYVNLPMYNDFKIFLDYVGKVSLEDLTKEYVDTFDFNKNAALYLTYRSAGEERERGQQLLELKALYAKAGFVMTSQELSDYLLVVLEFLAIAPIQEANQMFAKVKSSIESIYKELEKIQSPYTQILHSILVGGELLVELSDSNDENGKGEKA